VYEGTYYFTTPKGETFALDATTGSSCGSTRPRTSRLQRRHGGRQPGVAIGEGKVFNGTRDGYIIALNQQTGQQIWKTEVGPWRKGSKVSAAPIYANGIVLVGDSTGDNGGISASRHAYDATNGREVWTWTVVPQPGAPGGNTWPANDPQGRHYAGGSMWESPVVDTQRGLAIFGTATRIRGTHAARARTCGPTRSLR
jgi:Glucose dehydrogenase